MIETFNELFGVDNSVSVPTLVTITIFALGIILNFLFSSIKNYAIRRNNRKVFIVLIKEIIKDLKSQEKYLFEFRKEISKNTDERIYLKYRPIKYLNSVSNYEFNSIYNSFNSYFFYNCKSSPLQNKAFHRIYGILNSLTIRESELTQNLKEYDSEFRELNKEFDLNIISFLNYFDENRHKIKDIDLIKRYDKIIGKKRTSNSYRTKYKKIIEPLLNLFWISSFLEISNNSLSYLNKCKYNYSQIENNERIFKDNYKHYYNYYRKNRRILEICIKIVK